MSEIQLLASFPSEEGVRTMVGWLNDRELMRYSEQRHCRHTPETQWAYIRSMQSPNWFWSVMDVAIEGMVGTVTAYVDENNSVANLGILIPNSNRGYGTTAWNIACNTLFKRGIRKIEAGCMSDNIGMMRVCEKSGMLIEGWRNKHFILDDGSYSHLVHWGKFK